MDGIGDEDGVKVAVSAFKQAQQRHRRQGVAPHRSDDLHELVDFSSRSRDDRIVAIDNKLELRNSDDYTGPLFGLSSVPDFLYAPQALSPSEQLELAYLSVSQYCEPPHRTNIDLVPPRKDVEELNVGDSMWELWKKHNNFSLSNISGETEKKQKKKKKMYRSFDKLSWSTMGYHYDWTARAYREESKSPVPESLARLASLFARTSLRLTSRNQNSSGELSSCSKFTSSACIVNYYHTKSIMGGHQDDLEYTFDKPVVSLSLGLPAVFLLGGPSSKQDPVVPILVRPGDVLMMGGQSRLCIHGMARVIPAAVQLPDMMMVEPFQQAGGDGDNRNVSISIVPDSDKEALEAYLSQHRININVRQVLPDGVYQIPSQDGAGAAR